MIDGRLVSVREVGDVHVISVVDSHRFSDFGGLTDELAEAVANSNDAGVVLDFARLSYCTSDIIDLLIVLSQRQAEPLKLCRVNSIIRDGLSTAKLMGTFDVYDSVEDAVAESCCVA